MDKLAYSKWASEYESDAQKVYETIQKKREELKTASKDRAYELQNVITVYRRIYREMCDTARLLRRRGGVT